MRAMILKGPGVLEPGEVDKPTRGAGEVLVRMTHSGICGTDLEIHSGGIPVDYPRIMGHEMIGEIAETTKDGPAIGSRVIVDPVTYCGTCFHCQAGQINICPNGALIGRDQDGGFADFLAVPEANVYVLADGIGNKEASLIQVLTTCYHAQQLGPVKPGESVVVIGLGVTGQLHVQLAKASGAGTIIGITRSAWKRELAETLGADTTLEPGDDHDRPVIERLAQAEKCGPCRLARRGCALSKKRRDLLGEAGHARAAEPSSLRSCSTFMILSRAAEPGETSGRR